MKNKFNLLVAFLALGIAFTACNKDASVEQQDQSQPRELGALFLPTSEYAKIPTAVLTRDEQLKALPTAVILQTPAPGDQGGEGSCVAWGTTFAARSITKHIVNSSYAINTDIFSPEYVYNQIKATSDCGSGSYVTTGLNLLRDQGVCTWASMPYTDVSCSLQPNATQKYEATNYKVTYAKINITTAELKAHLAAGRAVVVAGSVNNDFMYLANNSVLTRYKGKSLGGHCYCVIGYDDAKNAFKFQNSWGTSWASAGFGWINYSNIGSWWREAYVMYNN